MKTPLFITLLLTSLAGPLLNSTSSAELPANRVVRCAVIGGMTMTGLWPALSRQFEEDTGYQVQVVATGPRPILDEAFRAGKADLITMHSGDITTDLVADGFAVNMRPWTRNELCIVGPTNDPARIRGMTNGAAALQIIARTKSRFVDFQGIGSREMTHSLWRIAGVEPKGDWVLRDDSANKWDLLQFARSNHAYVIVGYMPARLRKMNPDGMDILVQGDPLMRRPYIVMEANSKKLPGVNQAGARALADYLLSAKVQSFLTQFGTNHTAGGPLFHPVESIEAGSTIIPTKP